MEMKKGFSILDFVILDWQAGAAISLAASLLASAQPPPTQKQVPPAGVKISDTDRADLEKGTAELGGKLSALKKNPKLAAPLADVTVLHKAVDWALRYDEFMDVKQVKTAKELLAEGKRRADDLLGGKASWIAPGAGGVRGYVSRIDDSVQPYGVSFPADWTPGEKQARPVVLWFHGRAENLTELAFCGGQMKPKPELSVPGTIFVELYGRFCNASKFAGETDAFEALEDVARRTPIDRARVAVAGFSMGGASVWHFSTHHTAQWCAATPGAGFAETAIYAGVFKEGKTPPPWWEQMLWRWYDAPPYAENLASTSIAAYSGETDPQKASADLMEKVLAEKGMKLQRYIGPQTGHKYEPGTKKELEAWLSAKVAEGRKAVPNKVHLVTYTTRYNTSDWVTIDRMEKHWERAEVKAEILDEGTIKVETKGVAEFTLRFGANPVPLDKTRPPRVIVDGTELNGPPVAPPWVARFEKDGPKWIPADKVIHPFFAKRHEMSGPIDDAFLDRFIFVRPTGKPLHTEVGGWAKSELERAIAEWRRVFRGDAIVKDDKAITADDIANANLVLWGDPSSNVIIGKIVDHFSSELTKPGYLPKSTILKWTKEKLTLGPYQVDGAHYAPVLIYPNPLNPRRYVVLNSGFTFRMGSRTSNSMQTPKLPDWALIDLRTPPNDQQPGAIYDAGFFDENWNLK
jgi:dienelactone hydrolase